MAESCKSVVSFVGFHKSGGLRGLLDTNFPVVQVFTGSPRSSRFEPFSIPDQSFRTVILHGPFVTSFLKPNVDFSRKYLFQATSYALRKGIRYLVFHPGGIADGQSEAEAKRVLIGLMNEWERYYQGEDITLCLENKCGGAKDIANFAFLASLVVDLPEHVKLCFDTEHAYASGHLNLWEPLIQKIGVIHLNSIPQEVMEGSRVDRHSSTLLKISKNQDILLKIARTARDYNIPCVLERDEELVGEDLEFLKENL